MDYTTLAILGGLLVVYAMRAPSRKDRKSKNSGFIENFMFLVGLALALIGAVLLRKLGN